MPKAYIYSDDDLLVIGNDYIERQYSTSDNHLHTDRIINKRIKGEKSLEFSSFSSEFFIGFRNKKLIGEKTEFLSSNVLTLENINILKQRVEFIFKPYAVSGAYITFILNLEINDDTPWMTKYLEIITDERFQSNVYIDYIDCEHICFDSADFLWSADIKEKAYISKYHCSLGQPVYIDGLFFGSDFPLSDNKIEEKTVRLRYFSGKQFSKLRLSCGTTFRTWPTVVGAARGTDISSVKLSFYRYIRSFAGASGARFQYNSWYDKMQDIDEESIIMSFLETEDALSKSLVPPLDSYVIDDGFNDYDADFWNFNKKFPNGFEKISELVKALYSGLGVWTGPRGGYNEKTPEFARRIEKNGNGGYNRQANDVCVASEQYISKMTDYLTDMTEKYSVNYWKTDGFLLKACKSDKHGHVTGGYMDMYEYTEMWERWLRLFSKLRLTREKAGGDMWINQTSYSNPSPWFLRWSDSIWMQNSNDMGKLSQTDKKEQLLPSDADCMITYRDSRYYDFYITRQYQMPPEYLYNHDPIYGNKADITMTDAQFRKYLFMAAVRGNRFWELYYSYDKMSESKWRINADCIRFIRENGHILKNSIMIGGNPAKGEVYGYSSWIKKEGIVALRNPSSQTQKFSLVLDKSTGCLENNENMKREIIIPYSVEKDENSYSFGDSFNVTIEAGQVLIMKFSSLDQVLPKPVYSRYISDSEVMTHFDKRIRLKLDEIMTANDVEAIAISSDYSTVSVKLGEEQKSFEMLLPIYNGFGNSNSYKIKCKYYKDFSSGRKVFPQGRDFTLSFTLNGFGELIKSVHFSLCADEEHIYGVFFGREYTLDIKCQKNDKVTLVCEPNALIKFYINGEIRGSVYNRDYFNELSNKRFEVTDNLSDIRIRTRALKYSEVEKDE
ncbi:MAG: hypothetical protein K5761_02510 [Clostridiales bacterium]|nr:hypothetical protein [Clostridiales bacterium]